MAVEADSGQGENELDQAEEGLEVSFELAGFFARSGRRGGRGGGGGVG